MPKTILDKGEKINILQALKIGLKYTYRLAGENNKILTEAQLIEEAIALLKD